MKTAMTSTASSGPAKTANSLGLAGLGLIACIAFAIIGAWIGVQSWRQPTVANDDHAGLDAETVHALVIPAPVRGDAEAALLHRVDAVLSQHGVRLKSASFKSSANNAGLVAISCEFEGAPDAVWRAVYDLEAGRPGIVISRLRATSKNGGESLVASSEAVAAWAPAQTQTQRPKQTSAPAPAIKPPGAGGRP